MRQEVWHDYYLPHEVTLTFVSGGEEEMGFAWSNQVIDYAWISTAPGHASNQRPLRHSFSETDKRQFAIDCGKRNGSGEVLDPDCFPSEIYGAPNAKERDYKLPDLFFAGSYWAVSKAVADILIQFDLGEGAIYPVNIFRNDRTTRIDGDFYCINFGNRKNAFLPDRSSNVEIFVRDIWQARARMTDYDIALTNISRHGSDIWIDPQFDSAIFMSSGLGIALKKSKSDRGFFLKKCRII